MFNHWQLRGSLDISLLIKIKSAIMSSSRNKSKAPRHGSVPDPRTSSPLSDTTPPQLRVHSRRSTSSQPPECMIGTVVGTNTSPHSVTSSTTIRSPTNTVSTSTTTAASSSSSSTRVKKSSKAAKAAQTRKERELVQTTVTQMCRAFATKKKEEEYKKKKAEESSDDDDDLSEVIYLSSSGNTKKNNDDQYIECIGSTPPPASYPRSFYTPTMSDISQSKQSRNVKRMRDIMSTTLCQHCQNVICHDEQYGGFMEAKIGSVAKRSGKQTFTHIEIYEHCIGIYSVLAEYKVYDTALIVRDNVVTLPTCLYTGTYKKLLEKWLYRAQEERRDMLSHVAWSQLEQEMQNRKRRARKNSRYTH
jgi:hypothetical protein